LPENTSRVELHGCLVCGRVHNLLLVTSPEGKPIGYTAVGTDCHTLPGGDHALVVCNIHSDSEIEAALSRHHPGPEKPGDVDDD
jgi:hypothetical protein